MNCLVMFDCLRSEQPVYLMKARFGILKKYGSVIQDCIYERDVGFDVSMKRDPGNRHFEAPRSREKFKINSTFAFGHDGNHRKFKLSILDHADTCLL